MPDNFKNSVLIKLINTFKRILLIEFVSTAFIDILLLFSIIITLSWGFSFIIPFETTSFKTAVLIEIVLCTAISLVVGLRRIYKHPEYRIYYTAGIIIQLSLLVIAFLFNSTATMMFFSGFIVLVLILELYNIFKLKDVLKPVKTAIVLEKRLAYKGDLISAVEFITRKDGSQQYNNELKELFVNKVGNDYSGVKATKHLNIRNLLPKALIVLVAVMFVFLGEFIFNNKPSLFAQNFMYDYTEPIIKHETRYTEEVLFGEIFRADIFTNAELVAVDIEYENETLHYNIEASGNKSLIKDGERGSITITNIKPDDDNANTKKLKHYTFSFDDVSMDFSLNIKFVLGNKNLTIKDLPIKIIYNPRIEEFKYRVEYPDIYGLKDYTDTGNGNIQTYKGSKIYVEIECNNELKSAEIIFTDNEGNTITQDMIIDDADSYKANAVFDVEYDMDYTLKLIDTKGYTNSNNVLYSINIIQDLLPEIELLEPAEDFTTKDIDNISLGVRTQDDAGLKKVSLIYDLLRDEKLIRNGEIVLSTKSGRVFNWSGNVDLSVSKAQRGDTIRFYAQAEDIKGQRAQSKTISILYPDIYDVYEDIRATQTEEEERLEDLLKEQEELNEELASLDESVSASPEELSKKKEELIERQKELIKEIEETRRKLDETKESVAEDELSDEVQSRIDELNRLLEEMNLSKSKELDLMRKDLERGKQTALRKKGIKDEEYIDRLKKAIEKLKTLKDISRLSEAEKITQNIIKDQEDINNDIKSKGKTTKDKLDKLNLKADKLEELLKDMETDSIYDMSENVRNSSTNLNNKIKKDFNSSAVNTEQRKKSSETGQELQSGFTKLQNDLSELIKETQSKDISELINFLDAFSEELIQFTKDFIAIENDINLLNNKSGDAKQEEYSAIINDLLFIKSVLNKRMTTFDTLVEGVLPPNFKQDFIIKSDKAQGVISETAEHLNKRSFFMAIRNNDNARRYINILTLDIIKLKITLKNSTQNGGGGGSNGNPQQQSGGSPDDMNSLAEAQQRLNRQLENFLGQAKNGELSDAEKESLENMGEEQKAIADRLGKQYGSEQSKNSTENQSIKNELEAIRKELEEIADKLKNFQADEQMSDAQKELLKRMMEAKDGIEGEEYKEEREAQQALNQILNEDNQEDLNNKLKEILKNQDLNNINTENLSPEYIQYIIDYFKRLKEIE